MIPEEYLYYSPFAYKPLVDHIARRAQFKKTGEFRPAKIGEYYIGIDGKPIKAVFNMTANVEIIAK